MLAYVRFLVVGEGTPQLTIQDPSVESAAPAVPEPGFVALFNGRDLTGWTGATGGYAVEDGLLVCRKDGGGNLYVDRPFSDFVLRFAFRMEPGGNNGVGIRAEQGKDAAYHGMEIQILDDDAPAYAGLKPWQFHGSIYGVVPAKRGALKPAGQWNEQEITARGTHVRVVLNGTTIVDADLEVAVRRIGPAAQDREDRQASAAQVERAGELFPFRSAVAKNADSHGRFL